MKTQLTITFMLIFFKCSLAIAPFYENIWVVWNIGQGQWVTHVLQDRCLHYDVGGETNTFKLIRKSVIKLCSQKENEINLSHWDFDHYSQLTILAKSINRVCWQTIPTYENQKKSAQKVLVLPIPKCTNLRISEAWSPLNAVKSTNDSSIVQFDSGVLAPGDSTLTQEKFWIQELSVVKKTQILILGHHGSRTSTGNNLLKHLPILKMAIASARFKKYKHPHQQTIDRLRRFHIPMLKTEDWGNIWFSL